MQPTSFKNRFYKAVSIVLLYAMILDLSVPTAMAIGELRGYRSQLAVVSGYALQIGGSHASQSPLPGRRQIPQSLQTYVSSVIETAALSSSRGSQVQWKSASLTASQALMMAGGPGQNDNSGFSLNVHDGLLNKFTGDMNYTIPLMDVEGFPINISYSANVGMEQEASWVGLGWDLSLGSINRDMRGIPDDFAGDVVSRIYKTKDEAVDGYQTGLAYTYGYMFSIGSVGASAKFLKGRYNNNYTGVGHTLDLGIGASASLFGVANLNGGLGFSIDDQNGIGRSGSFGFGSSLSISGFTFGGDYGHMSTIHSRNGMKSIANTTGQSAGLKIKNVVGFDISSSHGSFLTYGIPTYVPRYPFDRSGSGTNNSSSFGFTYIDLPSAHNIKLMQNLYANAAKLTALDNSLQAYGYGNLSKSENNDKAMLDFNRDGYGSVSVNSKHMGMAVSTHDMYYCNAPGLSTTYRPHRYEVFPLHDPEVASHNRTDNGSSSFSPGYGSDGPTNIVTVGITNGSGTSTQESTSGKGDQLSHFGYTRSSDTYDQKEYYLKSIGEMTPADVSLLDDYQGETPASLEIAQVSESIALTGNISTGSGTFPLPADNKNLSRPDNIVHYRELSGSEMETYEIPVLSHHLYDCDRGLSHLASPEAVDLVSTARPGHLTSGVEVVNNGGMRYQFSIPSINYKQKEVSFSASGLKELHASDYQRTGLVVYGAGDNTIGNARGRQEMYDATTIPAYASTFLLTNMYSSDYVDRTQDGPTPDDQGNYYKINYTNLYDEAAPFKWRMPMTGGNASAAFDKQPNLAFFQENLNTDPWDDAANYVYGEKDVWYGQSVESKNFVALFCLGDRMDQFSAAGENGGLDVTKPGKYLKRIELYSRAELSQESIGNVKPIQVVEFEYDYSLCQDYVGNINSHGGYYPGTNSQGTGKLTLKRIYTYSGSSGELKTIPIEFEYSATNPDYAFNSTDRWGNYKPNDLAAPNHLIPYSEQDATAANANIQAWKLKKVKESSGATMEFYYAADTYAYVQDKKAMRMFNVVGMSDIPVLNSLSDIASPNAADLAVNGVSHHFRRPTEKKEYYDVVYFKLETPISGMSTGDAYEEVKKRYFTDANGHIPDEFLFNMHSKLGKESGDRFETVQSMATLGKNLTLGSYIGVVGESGPFEYGYVVIQSNKINDGEDHYFVTPLQEANWQFARLNAPYTIYGTPDYSATDAEHFCDYNNTLDYNAVFKLDINKKINRLAYGNEFMPDRSFIRLFEPDIKIGGNARLVAIDYSDGWNEMSGEAGAIYRWEYKYEIPSKVSLVTSGVAAYEPRTGGDENPHYQMDAYSTKRFRLPDEKSYQFLPLGEMHYPSPVVGYCEVSTSFGNTAISIAKSVGTNIERYYTAFDHPTISRATQNMLKVNRTGSNVIENGDMNKELVGFSEGFVVVTNDFHGKIKESQVLDASGAEISHSIYAYYDPAKEDVKYLGKDGTVKNSFTPREIDMYTESWKTTSFGETNDQTKSFTFGAIFPMPFIPYFIPLFSYGLNLYSAASESEVQGFTFEKVINHSAVLSSVTTVSLGSHNTAQNELFDPRSGDVLLSSLKDEFNDRLYSFSYPAHWKYGTFLNRNQTDNAWFDNISGTGNIISVTSAHGLQLTPGDHLMIYTGGTLVQQAWVLEVSSAGNAKLVDENGEAVTGITWASASIRVVQTGRKNLLSGSVMAVTTKKRPLTETAPYVFTFPETDIISASATLLLENLSVPCTELNGINTIRAFKDGNTNSTAYEIDEPINPFLQGVMGNYRPFGSFAFQDARTNFEDPNGIRKNGTLKNYVPYYKLSGGNWYGLHEFGHPDYAAGNIGSWRLLGHVDEYSEWGTSTQATDQISVSQSGITAFNRDMVPLQSASSVNAAVREIGFDGFEAYADYHGGGAGVATPQFSLSQAFASGTTLSTAERHSGRYSMKVATNSQAEYGTFDGPATPQATISGGEYLVRACNCISNFAPTPEKEYLVSVWVKEESGDVPFTHTSVTVEYEDQYGSPVGSQQIFTPDGPLIEGWQKIEGKYTIPAGAAKVRFIFVNTNAGASYFDDFRTHPFRAGMTSAIYDPKTLQPLAEHDGYNYTTFYNYDENHQLVRIKVETTEGIKTISETETGSKRQN